MVRLKRLRRIAASRLPIATKDQLRAVQAEGTAWAKAYEQLLAAAQGRPVRKPPRVPPTVIPDLKLTTGQPAVAVPTSEGLDSIPFAQWIAQGASVDEAAVRTVRLLLAAKQAPHAASFAGSLAEEGGSAAPAGALASGVVASHRGYHHLASRQFSRAQPSKVYELAPLEFVRSTFAAEPQRTLQSVDSWLADPAFSLPAKVWFDVLKQVFVRDDPERTQRVFDKMVAVSATEPAEAWPDAVRQIDWVRRWLGRGRNTTAQGVPEPGHLTFGLVDYVQPGYARMSQNIGDHIQTLASIGHVVRHQNLRFHGDPKIVAFMQQMQRRVPGSRRVESAAADIDVLTVERDSSTYQEFPENTWLVEFGWHMHGIFGLDVYDLPLHRNLNPIFVSFHCNKRELLTPEALEYLRAHGPIGCRDWTTVDLLLSLEVPAFFSGCLTTTVDTVFPPLDQQPKPATVYVDVARTPVPPGHENVRQSYAAIKARTFTENMWDAVELLERYRRTFTHVVTTRLHCYLPTRSLGLRVQFDPHNNADVRFNGLFRLNERDFDAIRDAMLARLEVVLTAIFAGESKESVYGIWRELVADEVRLAEERHVAAEPLPPVDVASIVGTLAAQGPLTDGPVDVVLTPTLPQNKYVEAVLRSAAASSSRPIRAWILAAGPAREIAIDGVDARWIDISGLTFAGSSEARVLGRVLLPDLLPSVNRAILLPVDAVVLGDVAELADIDLAGMAVAARTTSGTNRSGFAVFYRAAKRHDPHPERAHDFYRRIHARHRFDFDAFDLGVAVLDLDRLRGEGFAAQALASISHFALNDLEAYHLHVGAHRVDLDATWASVPTREVVPDAKVLQWVEPIKPWSKAYVPHADVWRRFAQ